MNSSHAKRSSHPNGAKGNHAKAQGKRIMNMFEFHAVFASRESRELREKHLLSLVLAIRLYALGKADSCESLATQPFA